MTRVENFGVTMGMCFLVYLVAVLVPDLTNALTLLGATMNPLMGYVLPCIYYLMICKEGSGVKRFFAYLVILFSVLSSIAVIGYFIHDLKEHTFH
jgi:amino acid permease